MTPFPGYKREDLGTTPPDSFPRVLRPEDHPWPYGEDKLREVQAWARETHGRGPSEKWLMIQQAQPQANERNLKAAIEITAKAMKSLARKRDHRGLPGGERASGYRSVHDEEDSQ